ncbi:GspMb/PilO family protein [Phenylobacterium sp. LH3H17]|uniref:GspMb/PilO family protein n=1 Tax=Phenylobacterium sp. LH3H17 TaxID=2903901 RepID=UPI0020CA0F96|nr:GspMb/PilO family protein [Phenylobacterium sp. LH3H17]UTP39753.1 GspMb/PilO family protein [Phenylobacterium sp. LH3H17]
MILQGPPTARDAFIVTGAVAGCALGLGMLLATIAAPKAVETRARALEAQVPEIARLMRPGRGAATLQPGTICAGTPARQAQDLRAQLTSLAGERQLGLTALDVRIEPAADPRSKVTPIRFRFEVSGPYDGAIELLRRLAANRPMVFADTVDLSSQTSSVTLAFSGRVFCGE